MENTGSLNEKLDRLASWVGTNVASAFFSSLESCACVNLTTSESDDDEEAKDRPLMFTNHQFHAVDSTRSRVSSSVDTLPV